MRRRDFFCAIVSGLMLSPVWGLAQQSGRRPVVGLLITHPPLSDPVVDWLRDGLAKFGYKDGRNIRLEARTASGQLNRVAALARELVELPVDVIVLVNDVAMRAVLEVSDTIPIVSVGYTNDPHRKGWIDSYRRPGGNVTGLFNVNSALGAKRLEMLEELLPEASRIAVLWDPSFGGEQFEELRQVAPNFGLELHPLVVDSPEDIGGAFEAAVANKYDAVLLVWTPVFYLHRARIAELGLKLNMPTICDLHPIVEAGALISLGSDVIYPFERAAYYVSRILKGARASDLPVERLSKLRFVVNLRTAKAIGVSVPQSILFRADEVIE
ncbi:MAG: ABC transporter substrate-binding protein [Betaproteobacteria bacterium]|nr:MAG: ABC transporter substrate-binding protein [Betaproteobacteria bacterium]